MSGISRAWLTPALVVLFAWSCARAGSGDETEAAEEPLDVPRTDGSGGTAQGQGGFVHDAPVSSTGAGTTTASSGPSSNAASSTTVSTSAVGPSSAASGPATSTTTTVGPATTTTTTTGAGGAGGGTSVGCLFDGLCTADDDCVCADCDLDPYCSDPLNCVNDSVCDAYSEGCVCADCASHPECVF